MEADGLDLITVRSCLASVSVEAKGLDFLWARHQPAVSGSGSTRIGLDEATPGVGLVEDTTGLAQDSLGLAEASSGLAEDCLGLDEAPTDLAEARSSILGSVDPEPRADLTARLWRRLAARNSARRTFSHRSGPHRAHVSHGVSLLQTMPTLARHVLHAT